MCFQIGLFILPQHQNTRPYFLLLPNISKNTVRQIIISYARALSPKVNPLKKSSS